MMGAAQTKRPRIVITGCGCGGADTANAQWRAGVSINLVARQNHHLFQPLLYKVLS